MQLKRALPIAIFLALVLAVPAVSQGDGDGPDLAKRVEVLEKKLAKQAAALKAAEDYMAVQTARGAALARALDAAEKKGFLHPGANTDAKAALVKGLRALVGAKKKAAKR